MVVSPFLFRHLVMNQTRLSLKMYCHQSLNSLRPQEQVCHHSVFLYQGSLISHPVEKISHSYQPLN